MLPNTTAVPNALFDVHLRKLKIAELKVVLVVIRQTLGWSDQHATTKRKEKDWISNGQLLRKTGCSRRAISYATDVLVSNGLIEVLDICGNALTKPSARKGKIRLYYRLAPTLLVPVDYRGITGEYPVNTAHPSAAFAQHLRKEVTALAQSMRITKPTLPNQLPTNY